MKTPKLAISTVQSLANSLLARLSSLVPSLASDLSPALVYLPEAVTEVEDTGLTATQFAWTCPDGITQVQVECYGTGGGGGGGSVTVGGGGGGGGEYACEPNYPVVPGETYSYYLNELALAGISSANATDTGDALMPGGDGTATHFDFRGKGKEGGVVAHGGTGGDVNGIGVGGRGGTGSSNAIHFDGGDGASSASGVQSDNPVLGLANGKSAVQLHYRLDDPPSEDPGNEFAFDYSCHNAADPDVRESAAIVKNTGAIVHPTTEIASPVQVPFGVNNNWWGDINDDETPGACWKFSHGSGSGYIGGIVAPVFALANMTDFSVSTWIRGSTGAASATDWGDSASGTKVLVGNMNMTSRANKGWSMWIDAGLGTLNFTVTQSTGTTQTISCAAPAANDGNWHMCTVTYAQGSNHFILYVDGVAQTTTTATPTSIAAGTEPITLGINKTTLSMSFKGYMSNAWVATTEVPVSYIAFAYGNGVATGGGGGGASGGSAGAGLPGSAAIGATGGTGAAGASAAIPGINHGSGAGGNGGDADTLHTALSGDPGPPSGGGGGGAGKYTPVTATYTAYLPCNMSASYTGFDAQGGQGGQLYTVSADPQADVTSPWYSVAAQQSASVYTGGRADSPFQGSMFSVLTFPSFSAVTGSAPTGAGNVNLPLSDDSWLIESMTLRLTVNTPNACNVMIASWLSNQVYRSLPADAAHLDPLGYGGNALIRYIDAGTAGRQVDIDLSSVPSLITDFVSTAVSNGHGTAGCGLILGQLNGSDEFGVPAFGSWNSTEAEDWYCSFTGADADNAGITAIIAVKYTLASGNQNAGGTGAPGYIVVSYINPQGTPVATVLPAAITDAKGNALGAGFTADAKNYNVWKPGSSPRVIDSWIQATMLNGWTGNSGTPVVQYKIEPGNLLHIVGLLDPSSKSSNTAFVLNSGYRPNVTHDVGIAMHPPGVLGAFARVDNSGNVQFLNSTTGMGAFGINVLIPLIVST